MIYGISVLLLCTLSTTSFSQTSTDPIVDFASVQWDRESGLINFSLSGDIPINAAKMDIVLSNNDTEIFLQKDASTTSSSVTIEETHNTSLSGKVVLTLVFKTAAKKDTPSNEIMRIKSSQFQFSAPKLEILTVSYDAQKNVYTIVYGYSDIKTGTDVTVSLSDEYQDFKTVEEVTVTHKSEKSKIVTVKISAKNLIPALFGTRTACLSIYAWTQTDERISDYKFPDFDPQLSYKVFFYLRYYWYITLMALLFSGYVTFRQIRWYRTVHFAPFAFLPFQRRKASIKRTQLWQSLKTLNELYQDINHPTKLMRQTIQRVERLCEMPSSIEKLTSISTEISQGIYKKSGYYGRISKHYDEAFILHNVALLRAEVAELAEQYWAIDEICRSFVFNIEFREDDVTGNLIKSFESLSTSLRKLINNLNPHASLFTRPTEAQSYQYLTEIQLIVNQARKDLRDNFQLVETAFQNMKAQMESLLAALPHDEHIVPKFDKDKASNPEYQSDEHPLSLLFKELMVIVDRFHEHIIQYSSQVINRLRIGVGSINRVEDIPVLDQILESIEARHFGNFIDTILNGLENIARDVSSALAQVPQSYGRRLSLQDAHITTRDLYARLLPEAPEIADDLQRIAALFEESSRREESEDKKTYDNPYITGNPIRARNIGLFKGRANLASDLVNRLRGARNSTILLHGGRRMGKSSFLYHLENLLPATYISVFVDCQGAVTESEKNFFYQIARKTFDVLRRRNRIADQNLTRPRAESYSESPALSFEEWLTDEVGPVIKDRVLLVTLDEFESIGNAIRNERISIEILNSLRHLIQHNEYITFMFAGVAKLDTLAYNAASYFISVSTVELSYLDNAAAKALILRPFKSEDVASQAEIERNVPQYDDEAVKRLIYLTFNQPFLIQAMCEQLVNLANDRQLEKITLEDIEEVASRIHKDYPNYFEFFLNNWREDGRIIFESIIHDKFVPSELNEVVEDMLRHRVIERIESGKLRIEVPLMEKFIRMRVS